MKRFVCCLILATTLCAEVNDVFPMFTESGSMLQSALNGGGSTLPDKGNGVTLNPATLFVYHKLYAKGIGFGGSFWNDKDDRLLANGYSSFAVNPKSVIAVDYLFRDKRDGGNPNIHRGTFAYSGVIQDDKVEGTLTWGMNLSYYQNSGNHDAMKYNTIIAGDTSWTEPSGISTVAGYHHVVSTDLGFYQYDAQRGFSYAIVVENLFGYSWQQRDNSVVTVGKDSTYYDADLDSTLSTRVDTVKYSGQAWEDYGKLSGKSKSLLVGVAVQRAIAGGNAILTIPLDVRFWGFMDGDLRDNSEWKNRCMMRLGMVTNFDGAISLRVGYSWAPEEYYTDAGGNPQFVNTHQASGGFSLTLKGVDLEMAFKKGELGAGASFFF